MPTRRDGAASWMFLHDGMPDHPKIEGLSDRAFRALIELWCYCSRNLTDGYVTETAWLKRTTPRVRRELLAADLVELAAPGRVDGISTESRRDSAPNGVVMHDYLDWQRSAAEAAEFSSKKAAAGTLGNHRRWHVAAGRWSPDCKFCVDAGPPERSQDPSHERSQMRSHERSQMGSQTDRTRIAEGEGERDRGSVGRERPVSNARAKRPPTPQKRSQQHTLWPAAVLDDPADHPPRCPDHADIPPGHWVPPCGACAALREQHQAAEHERAAAEAARAAERDVADQAAAWACTHCDDENWITDSDGEPVTPARRCDRHVRKRHPRPGAAPPTLHAVHAARVI